MYSKIPLHSRLEELLYPELEILTGVWVNSNVSWKINHIQNRLACPRKLNLWPATMISDKNYWSFRNKTLVFHEKVNPHIDYSESYQTYNNWHIFWINWIFSRPTQKSAITGFSEIFQQILHQYDKLSEKVMSSYYIGSFQKLSKVKKLKSE